MKSSPPSRSSRPRPAASGTPSAPPSGPPKAKPRRPAAKTSPTVPLSANERGIQRRAKKKVHTRRTNWTALFALLAATSIIVGAAAGIRSELKSVKSRVASKQTTLAALKAQLESGQKRLSAFTNGTGRERALAENGYIRPGERILLFPRNKK